MAEYEEVEGTVEVPKNVGVAGFLRSIEAILKQPRVQSISIDARGKVTFRRFIREGEKNEPIAVDFETLNPSAIIRNGTVVELPTPTTGHTNAAVAIGQLFNMMALDKLNAVSFVGGANSRVWKWYKESTGIELVSHDELYGVPFVTDRHVEDQVLMLCAAYAKPAALIDTQKSYKLVIQ